MLRTPLRMAALGLAVTVVSSCGAIKSAAIKSVADTLSEGGTAVTSHDNPELVADALPFSLLLNESLLASVPKHGPLLTATCGRSTRYPSASSRWMPRPRSSTNTNGRSRFRIGR